MNWLERGQANRMEQQEAARLLREWRRQANQTMVTPWLAFACGLLAGALFFGLH